MHVVMQRRLTNLKGKILSGSATVCLAAGLIGAPFVVDWTGNALVNPAGVAVAAISGGGWVGGSSGRASVTRLAVAVTLLVCGAAIAQAIHLRSGPDHVMEVVWFGPWWALYLAVTEGENWRIGESKLWQNVVEVIGVALSGALVVSLLTLMSLAVLSG